MTLPETDVALIMNLYIAEDTLEVWFIHTVLKLNLISVGALQEFA